MKSRGVCITLLGMALVVGLAPAPARGYLGVLQSLGQVTSDAQVIVVLEVEKVSRENKVIVYKKVADLKGNHPGTQVSHHIASGDDARDAEAILNWAAPGKTAIFFQSRGSGLTCIGRHWHACAAAKEAPWWTMTRGAYEMSYAYFGSTSRLRSHVAALLEGKTVAVTALDPNELVAYRFLATRELLRSAAAGALGAIGAGARDAVGALAAALDDADEAYRWTLVTALARIGGPRSKVVVPFLVKAIANKSDTDMNCYRALILLVNAQWRAAALRHAGQRWRGAAHHQHAARAGGDVAILANQDEAVGPPHPASPAWRSSPTANGSPQQVGIAPRASGGRRVDLCRPFTMIGPAGHPFGARAVSFTSLSQKE